LGSKFAKPNTNTIILVLVLFSSTTLQQSTSNATMNNAATISHCNNQRRSNSKASC
jgi:hypothetical protein